MSLTIHTRVEYNYHKPPFYTAIYYVYFDYYGELIHENIRNWRRILT